MAEMAGCETPNLKVACSSPMRCKTFLIRCLFLFFLIALSIAAFLSCSCLCLRGVALPLYICIFEIIDSSTACFKWSDVFMGAKGQCFYFESCYL